MEVNLSLVASLGYNNFITIPAKNAPKMFSAPTRSATVTKAKIKKKAKRISNWVVALVTLLNQRYGCLKRRKRKIAATKSRIISHNCSALPPLTEA